MSERPAFYGVQIVDPTPGEPCLMCLEALATEIEEACAGTDITLLPRKERDWRAVVRTGRIALCAPHVAHIRVALSDEMPE